MSFCKGFQTYELLPEVKPIEKFMAYHLNNAGDPFFESYFQIHTKQLEVAVLDYMAKLWNIDKYWGYVLNMGSTEGNLDGHWFAREYFNKQKKNGYSQIKEPVALFGQVESQNTKQKK